MADSSRDASARRVAWPVRGQIVTFLQGGDREVRHFARAVATGDVVVDPDTGFRWLPVIKPDLVPALLDIATVVDLEPARESQQPPGKPGVA